MKSQVKILIGNDCLHSGVMYGNFLTNLGFSTKNVPKNGITILSEIKNFKPDILIINEVTEHIDALGVINTLFLSKFTTPSIIIIKDKTNTSLEKNLQKYNIKCHVVDNDNIELVCKTVISISDNITHPVNNTLKNEKWTMFHEVTDIIKNLGVPAHVKGYNFIRDSILLAIQNNELLYSITKTLYPTVAQMHNTTASRVERAIRHAVSVTWERGNVDALNNLFGFSVHDNSKKPTNSEFIAIIVDKITVQMLESKNA